MDHRVGFELRSYIFAACDVVTKDNVFETLQKCVNKVLSHNVLLRASHTDCGSANTQPAPPGALVTFPTALSFCSLAKSFRVAPRPTRVPPTARRRADSCVTSARLRRTPPAGTATAAASSVALSPAPDAHHAMAVSSRFMSSSVALSQAPDAHHAGAASHDGGQAPGGREGYLAEVRPAAPLPVGSLLHTCGDGADALEGDATPHTRRNPAPLSAF
eukprot:9487933-Pyramimonas_sp.AAC.1